MLWILCILGLSFRSLVEPALATSENHRFSIATSLTAPYHSFPPYSNISEATNQSYGQIPDVYVPLPAEEKGACSITDQYCTYNGTARNPDGLGDQCLLWDDTCSGNQTLAINRFFGQTQEFLHENICFTADGQGSVESNCTSQNTPARFAEFKRIKSWMRSPQCIASQGVYQKAHLSPDTEGMHGEKRSYEKRDNSREGLKYGGGTCCGDCNLEAGNVDVFYWPAPNANNSCLSVIGSKVNPPDYGATTDSLGLRYWGCTKPLTGIPGQSVETLTTASVVVTGSRSWKAYLENPWDATLCPSTASAPLGSNGSVKARALDREIYARGHTLVVPASVSGSPVTTVVSRGVTFTSPSIYAAFSDIGAYDSCGGEVISTTMLSFAPGELSTIVGGLANIGETTRPFNFADLPCPPYRVAHENFYKPAPGEPYRPLIAIPSQVRTMLPWLQYCTDLWFTGYDPPRILVPAAAVAPPVTASDPAAPITTPQTSATQDPGAKKTGAGWNPIPLPPATKHASLPKETHTISELQPQVPKETNQVPIIKPQTPQSTPPNEDPAAKHQDSSQQGGDPTDPSSSSKVQSGSGGDPKIAGDPSGQPKVQDGSNETTELPGAPNQDGSKDPTSPTLNQGAIAAQVATVPASQHTSENQISGSDDFNAITGVIPTETTMSIGSHAVVAGPSAVHVDGVEVNPNQAAASISGAAAINQGNSIVVASQIFQIPAPTEHAPTTMAGQTVVPIANGVSIQGTSVTGTTPAVILGTTISVDKSRLYIGNQSFPLPTGVPASVTTLANGAVALPMSNAISVYGTTLTAGAPAATISGTAVSLDSSSNLIFDGTAQALPSFSQTTSPSDQTTTINSVAVKLLPSGISVAGTTLTPGAPAVTASGLPVSLGSTILAVGTSSVPVSFGSPQVLITTIGSQVITAAATAVNIGSATLTPGAQGTKLGGTVVSLGSGGSLVVGSKTVALGAPTGRLGGLINGGFGSAAPIANGSSALGGGVLPTNYSNSTNSGVQNFEGKASRLRSLTPESLAGFAVALQLLSYLHI